MVAPGTKHGQIHLWWTTIDASAPFQDDLEGLLDDDERRRVERFRVERGRLLFLTARGMLRIVLGRAIGAAPSTLVFDYGDRGKPRLRGSETGRCPSFNTSHSGELAVVAMANCELGVDAEWLRPVPNAERLARRFFSEGEQRWILSHPPAERDAAFLRIWTCKEAYLKAAGLGIAMPLRDIDVDPTGPKLIGIRQDATAVTCWSLVHAPLPIPAVCTVAIRGSEWGVNVQRFDWSDGGALSS